MLSFSLAILLIGITSALPGDVADAINDAKLANCNSNMDNCWEKCGADASLCSNGQNADYTTNTITFEGVYASGSSCCYKYKSVYTANPDCNGNTPAQSHWMLDTHCVPEGDPLTISNSPNGGKWSDDKSTCYSGIKFDTGCSATSVQGGCNYEICFEQSSSMNGQCCYEDGWYMIKAGDTFSFMDIAVPSCSCRSPTNSPTTDPTKSPTTDPTISPTTDPTKSPTTDPTKSPTTDPTVSPTTDPTKSPTTDPTVSPTTDPTQSPSTDPTISPTTDPTESPSTDPTKSPTTDPTISPTTDPTKSPTTDPTLNPTPSPTSFCRPIIEIKVNPECTHLNLERDDTDIRYQNILVYENIGDLQGPFETAPSDPLSKIVLDHSCDTDNGDAAHSVNSVDINHMIEGIGYNEKDKKIINNKPNNHDPSLIYNGFAGLLVIYSVIMTFLYLKKNNNGYQQQLKQVDFDNVDHEEEHHNML